MKKVKETNSTPMNFKELVETILRIHNQMGAQVAKAVNVSLTFRNWLIGWHISEFELGGIDRSVYGEKLFLKLSEELSEKNVSACNRRQLYYYVSFYRTYPQIVQTLSPQLENLLPNTRQTIKARTLTAQSITKSENLLDHLSYSHFEALLKLEDSLKRSFYEIECMHGNWSVRELKRQIASLYFERSGLSKNKKKLSELAHSNAEQIEPKLTIRDPYIFEFLGLKPKEVMSESELEDSLLNKLQEFLLEMGHGFCFESRQKRILIGDEFFFIDLVFYHRILKCHVLIELKTGEFSHEHLGQLNTYVSWYKKNEMTQGDHPPIGLLLCTKKNHALAEYALAGIDNRLFVSKYQLELPKKEEIIQFLEEQWNRT